MSTVEDLLNYAVRLFVEQQLTLVSRILSASEPELSKKVEYAWDDTIKERISRFDHGKDKARLAGEALGDTKRKLRASGSSSGSE